MDYSCIFSCVVDVFQGLLDDFLLPEGPQMTQESVANTIYSADAAILKASKQDNKASSL